MTISIQADPIPLRDSGDGSLRVGSSPVLLEHILDAFQGGSDPETIVRNAPTLELADVYAVLAHYLRHRGEFDAYLKARQVSEAAVRSKIVSEGRNGSSPRTRQGEAGRPPNTADSSDHRESTTSPRIRHRPEPLSLNSRQDERIESHTELLSRATVAVLFEADPVPLRDPGDGSLRVGQCRVLLELVLHAFQDGEPPESIVESYDTLQLAEVYAVLAHYLRHPEPFDAYLAAMEIEAEEIQAKLEAIGAWRTIDCRSTEVSNGSERTADAQPRR